MAPFFDNEAASREPTPLQKMIHTEEPPPLTSSEHKILQAALCKTRHLRPDFFHALDFFFEKNCNLYHGFYVDLGKHLGLSDRGAKDRLGRALEFLAKRVRIESERRSER